MFTGRLYKNGFITTLLRPVASAKFLKCTGGNGLESFSKFPNLLLFCYFYNYSRL